MRALNLPIHLLAVVSQSRERHEAVRRALRRTADPMLSVEPEEGECLRNALFDVAQYALVDGSLEELFQAVNELPPPPPDVLFAARAAWSDDPFADALDRVLDQYTVFMVAVLEVAPPEDIALAAQVIADNGFSFRAAVASTRPEEGRRLTAMFVGILAMNTLLFAAAEQDPRLKNRLDALIDLVGQGFYEVLTECAARGSKTALEHVKQEDIPDLRAEELAEVGRSAWLVQLREKPT